MMDKGERKEEAFTFDSKPMEASKPKVIVGMPDVGLVGGIASAHMIDALKMEEIGYVDSDLMPPVLFIQEGEPRAPIRIFRKEDIVLVLVDVVLSTGQLRLLAKSLVKWVKSIGAEFLIGISGAPVPQRLEIEKPNVFGVGVGNRAREMLQKLGVQFLERGLLVGPYALVLRECMRQGQQNITIMAESHSQFPDPGAAASALEVLSKLLGKDIEVDSLLQKSEEIRLKAREAMQRMSVQQQRSQEEGEVPGLYIR